MTRAGSSLGASTARRDRGARVLGYGVRGLVSAASVALAAILLFARAATAVEPSARKLSPYEEESIRTALEQVGGEREPNPEGKQVEAIEVVPLDVIEPRDPAPQFLNWFHTTTRPYIIEREVLLQVGQPFAQALADETERNLRGFIQFSVVLLVPVKGSAADRVRILVVTKDVWSLRLNWDPSFYNGKLEYLSLQPSEQNLLGRSIVVSGLLTLTPYNYSVGASFVVPRIAGSRLATSASATAIVNCKTGAIEGNTFNFNYGQPLYSIASKWAWQTSISGSQQIVRPSTGGEWVCSQGETRYVPVALAPGKDVILPDRYTVNALSGSASVTRAFRTIQLSFGAEAQRRSSYYDDPTMSNDLFADIDRDDQGRVVRGPHGELLGSVRGGLTQAERESEFDTALRAYRQARLPTPDIRISPFAQVQSYSLRFQRLINYDTLGLQEDQRLGHYVGLRVYPALKAVGSTRNLFGTVSWASYTWPIDTGFLYAGAQSRIELSRINQTDAALSVYSQFVTPDFGLGRFVSALTLVDRYKNYSNFVDSLGGTDRLRGYRPAAFIGRNLLVHNLEFRSRPVEILSVMLGGVAFYDVGNTFARFDQLELKQGGGFGLRFGFPQLERSVFRIDCGFPLTRNDPNGEISVTAGFRQVIVPP